MICSPGELQNRTSADMTPMQLKHWALKQAYIYKAWWFACHMPLPTCHAANLPCACAAHLCQTENYVCMSMAILMSLSSRCVYMAAGSRPSTSAMDQGAWAVADCAHDFTYTLA